jgi:hypothetical protein
MHQYTIQQLLTKLKTTDDRINKAMQKPFCAMITGEISRTPVDKVYANELSLQTAIKSNGDSVHSLIANVAKVKLAIATANLSTFITVNGISMSVAEAIIQRSLLAKKKELLKNYLNQLSKLQQVANKTIEQSQNTLDSRTCTAEELVAARTAFEQYRQPIVIGYVANQQSVSEYLQVFEKEIEYYETEFDSALSQVNASTVITLDFQM